MKYLYRYTLKAKHLLYHVVRYKINFIITVDDSFARWVYDLPIHLLAHPLLTLTLTLQKHAVDFCLFIWFSYSEKAPAKAKDTLKENGGETVVSIFDSFCVDVTCSFACGKPS